MSTKIDLFSSRFVSRCWDQERDSSPVLRLQMRQGWLKVEHSLPVFLSQLLLVEFVLDVSARSCEDYTDPP